MYKLVVELPLCAAPPAICVVLSSDMTEGISETRWRVESMWPAGGGQAGLGSQVSANVGPRWGGAARIGLMVGSRPACGPGGREAGKWW